MAIYHDKTVPEDEGAVLVIRESERCGSRGQSSGQHLSLCAEGNDGRTENDGSRTGDA